MSCPKLLLKLQILKIAYVAIVLMVSKMFRGLTSEWNAIHKHDTIVIKLQKNKCCTLWKVKSDIIQCIHLCFCMLAISFYFVNCVIISCKLSFNCRFTRNQILIMSFLGFKKAELGCKMSELHLYVVKRQNWVVIIRK